MALTRTVKNLSPMPVEMLTQRQAMKRQEAFAQSCRTVGLLRDAQLAVIVEREGSSVEELGVLTRRHHFPEL